jgi:hypothetical protein
MAIMDARTEMIGMRSPPVAEAALKFGSSFWQCGSNAVNRRLVNAVTASILRTKSMTVCSLNEKEHVLTHTTRRCNVLRQ